MIIVLGHIRFAAGDGARARELLQQHMVAVAAEEGCEAYSFAFDAADPDLVRVAERWASADALAAHGAQPHQKEFGRALRAFTIEDIRVDGWEGEHWRTLIGG